MKRLIFISSAILITLGSCVNEKEGFIDPQQELGSNIEKNSIVMKTYTPKMMKGGINTDQDILKNGIMVYAYKTDDYSSTPYIDGIEFKYGSNVWVSSPVYYWPSYELDFFGYYPVSIKPTSTSAPTVFSYTIATEADKEEDVVMSFASKQSESPVPLEFQHALSKINFKIASYANSGLNVSVSGIKIMYVPISATFTYNTTATAVPNYFTISDPGSSTDSVSLTLSDQVSVTAGTSLVTSDSIGAFFLIPHTLTNWAVGQNDSVSYPMTSGTYIKLDAVLSGVADYTGEIAVPITTTEWQPGYSYTYIITFGDSSGSTGGGGYNPYKENPNPNKPSDKTPEPILMPITISVTVEAWDDQTPDDITL